MAAAAVVAETLAETMCAIMLCILRIPSTLVIGLRNASAPRARRADF
jgi:hypothetical protein